MTLRKNIVYNYSEICDMGCGNPAQFFYKSGKAYCCKLGANCPVKVKKDSDKKKGINPFEGREHPRGMTGKKPWNRGLTKEDHPSIEKHAKKLKEVRSTEEWKKEKGFKKHSLESKKKLSKIIKKRYAEGWQPVCGRAPKIPYTSHIAGEIILIGSWELIFAQILDKLNIQWTRNAKRFEYIKPDGKEGTYLPDFYIDEWNQYVEVKGYETDLDRAKWSQFKEPLIIIRRHHINKIRIWLKNNTSLEKDEFIFFVTNVQ
jgi:hypothetical protein